MKRHLMNFAVVFTLFVFLPMGCSSALEQESVEAPSEAAGSSLAPDFKLQDLSQVTYTLSSYREKEQPVILFFWTTWCPYCREELKVLKEKYAQLAVDGWEIFAVDVGESASRVDSFVKSYSLPFKVLLDKTTSVARSFQVMGVPTYVFVGKKGRVTATEHFFPEERLKELSSK